MTKTELLEIVKHSTRYVILEFRNHKKAFILNDVIKYQHDGFDCLYLLDENLNSKSITMGSDFDVVNVYYGGGYDSISPEHIFKKTRDIVSRYPRCTELTFQQIADKFGIPVENLKIKK